MQHDSYPYLDYSYQRQQYPPTPPTSTFDGSPAVAQPSQTLSNAYAYLQAPQSSFGLDAYPQEAQRDTLSGPVRFVPSSQRAGPSSNRSKGASIEGVAGGEGAVPTVGRTIATPYERPAGAALADKADSTSAPFTKRRDWCEHLLEGIQDFLHALTPAGTFLYASPSITNIAGWHPDELFLRPIFNYIHPSDVAGFRRNFETSLRTGEVLTINFRFKCKDGSFVLFEVVGHPYFGEDPNQLAGTQPHRPNGRPCKSWHGSARQYPSRTQAMFDSFLELKLENLRLTRELEVMYKEIEGETPSTDNSTNQPSSLPFSTPAETSRPVFDPQTGLIQMQSLIPSTSNTYGALGIGISTSGLRGDETGKGKKAKRGRAEGARGDVGDFVCHDCGRNDSPEWRRGPHGPKTLCNACGLRYAKHVSRHKKEAKEAAQPP